MGKLIAILIFIPVVLYIIGMFPTVAVLVGCLGMAFLFMVFGGNS